MESSPSATNWQLVCKLRRPGMHMLASMQAVAHGSDSVLYFQWRKGRGSFEKFHGAVVDHYGKSDTRVFRDVASVGQRLKKLTSEICATTYTSPAAMIYDMENRWAIGEMQGLHNGRQGYLEDLMTIYRPFFQNGVNVDMLDMESDFTGYKLVVAPMLYMLRGGIAEKLRRFVENGGTLVATYWSGIVDENDLCFLGGMPGDGMMELCGLRAEEIDALYPGESNTMRLQKPLPGMKTEYTTGDLCDLVHLSTAQALGTYGEDFYAGMPALTVNSFGKGKVYYVAARMGEDFYQDFLGALIGELSLQPFPVALPHKVTLNTRKNPETGVEYYFFQNFNAGSVSLALPKELKDVETGETLSALQMEGYGVRILRSC